jgi:hypothetical protein
MSNFWHLAHCKKCDQMTNHVFMDDTPAPHLYTTECTKCGHRPVQGEYNNSVLPDIRAMEEVDEDGDTGNTN